MLNFEAIWSCIHVTMWLQKWVKHSWELVPPPPLPTMRCLSLIFWQGPSAFIRSECIILFVIRYLPSSDLEEIYTEYYGEKKITKEEIEVCSALMLLGWIGEQIAGEKLFPKYARTSPFLVEDFHTYFQGTVAPNGQVTIVMQWGSLHALMTPRAMSAWRTETRQRVTPWSSSLGIRHRANDPTP